MFGVSYFTIGGYICGGRVYCADCFTSPESDGVAGEEDARVSVADLEASFGRAGCTCDTCGKELVPPAEPDREDYRKAALALALTTFDLQVPAHGNVEVLADGAWVDARIWVAYSEAADVARRWWGGLLRRL